MTSLLARTSVVVPALNEEATVAQVVRDVLADAPLEVLVIDADSTDATAARAQAAGAQVYNWRDILPEVPVRPGKGESLWRGVAAARGEFIAFIDADLSSTRPGQLAALVAPFACPEIALVKADYQRAFAGRPTGGGRVTELTAKPLLRALFPELARVRQPLGGEYAIRRELALKLPFVAGYGVEAGLLIDVARACGPAAIAEVDLGIRTHRNRPISELSAMADVVAMTILARAGVAGITINQRNPLAKLTKIAATD